MWLNEFGNEYQWHCGNKTNNLRNCQNSFSEARNVLIVLAFILAQFCITCGKVSSHKYSGIYAIGNRSKCTRTY